MDDLICSVIICVLITFVGSFIQRVSGFGFGIVVMTVFPFVFSTFGEATALSGLISVISTTCITLLYRKNISWRLLLLPIIAYIPVNYLAIWFVAGSNVQVLKMALGIFLVILSLYFIFFSTKLSIKPNTASGIIAGGVSGLLGGAFAMAGPPIVIYLLAATDTDKKTYIATIQCYFAITGCIATSGRIFGGFLTSKVLILLPTALLAIIFGNLIGGKVFKKLNPIALKYFVYIFMAIAGFIIFITAL